MARQHTSVKNSFRTINDVIENEKEFEKLKESLSNYNVVDEFGKMFPELSLIAKAIKLNNQTLFLKVENSVWKSELNFQKTILIERINKHFGNEVIKSIKFL